MLSLQIRPATHEDHPALARLAALDGQPVPAGDVLLGLVDGELRAAIALDEDRVIADPFHPTADIVALLDTRKRSLERQSPHRTARRLRALLPRIA